MTSSLLSGSSLIFAMLAILGACGDVTVDLITGPVASAGSAGSAGSTGESECQTDDDCRTGDATLCHPFEHRCVECVSDGHCEDPGEVCSARLGECARPCGSPADCSSDDPICDTVLGFCVECSSDDDCPRPGALCRSSECTG